MNKLATRRQFVKMLSLVSIAPSILYGNGFSKRQTVPRIGYLNGKSELNLETYFIDELKKLGFTAGENIHIEQRLVPLNSTDGDSMAAELAKMNLSLIVVGALPFALEVRKINPQMPMVIVTCPGMVSNGFAESMQHPGGIYTGIDELPPGITAKRLQLLKAVPGVNRVALLSTTPGTGGHEFQLAEAEKAAATLHIKIKVYRALSLEQLKKALHDLVSDGMNGLLNFQGGLSWANRQLIADFATENRLPAIYQSTVFPQVGGLMSWSPDYTWQLRETAHYVEKILNGAKPGDLPVKYPERHFLTLNKTAANKIGINFSKELLDEATKIIE